MLWLLLYACSSAPPGHSVRGTVVEVTAKDEVVIDHEAIPGFMDAMVMPFRVQDPALIANLEPGHRVEARLEIGESGGFLTSVEVTGKTAPPPKPAPQGPAPLRDGQVLPTTTVTTSAGTTLTLGAGQAGPVALTFLYTRCPMPDFCPATVAKFQALQAKIAPPVKLVAVTLDPAHDTPEVLARFAEDAGADPERWVFGTAADLDGLAMAAGMTVLAQGDQFVHSKRVLLLDAEGRRITRYDDLDFDVTQAASRLGGTP